MITFNNPYLYAKGTANVIVADPSTGNIDYQSTKVQTSQLTTSNALGAINAGLGNPIAIQIPTDCAVNLELTAADFSMATRAMQVGSSVSYNGIAPACEAITASGTTLTLTGTAVAGYGYTTPYCHINYAGNLSPQTAYEVNDSGEVVGFTATSGVTYIVHYNQAGASNQVLPVYSVFAPAIKHVTIEIAVYSSEGTSSASQSSRAGTLYIIVPRMQFSGKADTDGSQTANAPSALSGTALPYEASSTTTCTGAATPNLAYMVYVPAAGATSAVTGLAIVGGVVSVGAGDTIQTPVKYVMADGTLVQPSYSDLTYAIPGADSSIATVSSTGVITGVGAGGTEITVSLASPAVSTVANVTVTA